MKTYIKFIIIALNCTILLIIGSSGCNRSLEKDQIKGSDPAVNGYVPDDITAIKIAETIWIPIYGDNINKHKPFKAVLIKDSIWRVTGTVNFDKGGTPIAEIRKSDCKVLMVTHEK